MSADYGYGDGGGYGDGDGGGYGDGSGYGGGYGDGDGGGYGDGGGNGYGCGSGYGHGSGYGGGYGDGDVEKIGEVGGMTVALLAPWPWVRVGCHVHSLDHWALHWESISVYNDVGADPHLVEGLLSLAREKIQRGGK